MRSVIASLNDAQITKTMSLSPGVSFNTVTLCVGTIHPQSNRLRIGMKMKSFNVRHVSLQPSAATGYSGLEHLQVLFWYLLTCDTGMMVSVLEYGCLIIELEKIEALFEKLSYFPT